MGRNETELELLRHRHMFGMTGDVKRELFALVLLVCGPPPMPKYTGFDLADHMAYMAWRSFCGRTIANRLMIESNDALTVQLFHEFARWCKENRDAERNADGGSAAAGGCASTP